MKFNAADQLQFVCGATMKNRFMLAPLTNRQSHEDGTISEDELHWLVMRAKGHFGIVMTCASHVQANGKGFPGQLGIFGDQHIPGHKRLTKQLHVYGSLAVIQLHHAGMRAPIELIDGNPVAPSNVEKYGARALTENEITDLKNAFIEASIRAQKSNYDGVELHGAHGYILSQFLSAEINKRTDQYGGSLENRARLLYEIVEGIREKCGSKFLLGVRLSPERFGMDIDEIKTICQVLSDAHQIDFLDISLWDSFKYPENKNYVQKPLINYFTELHLNKTKLTVAGNIKSASDVQAVIDMGVDFVSIGRAGILYHDFPKQVMNNPNFEPISTPVSESYLKHQGLGPEFIEYMKKWDGFVK